ncbi:hypothetical protein BOTCAL_0158g00180 [Botryotinia calthae]|uniref:Uncharacterized protein n=1 Tax=Botryotinia calthae TaxID=38488 RepID=A0A4Y8D2G7_9HELO|nr:hypothetical protein BOTCAL_0158g00180 [Botryotinia calthae]
MDFFDLFQSFQAAQVAFVLIFFAFSVKIPISIYRHVQVIHRAYFTPLRKIPGPLYVRFTHIVL